MYAAFLKRVFDILLSGAAIILLSPVLLLLAVIIKLDSKGPVLFCQKRVGKDKAYFNILKFRTMYADTPKDMPTHLLSDPKSHITRIGKFLRLSSLDELPQLFNIFVGQMSIVGPRPALWNQDDLIAERDQYGVNALVPGLTGYAQVNGRDEPTIQEKARLDAWYVKNISFWADVKIIFWTVAVVFTHRGVVEGEQKNK